VLAFSQKSSTPFDLFSSFGSGKSHWVMAVKCGRRTQPAFTLALWRGVHGRWKASNSAVYQSPVYIGRRTEGCEAYTMTICERRWPTSCGDGEICVLHTHHTFGDEHRGVSGYCTEMCSGSEAGSYSRLTDCYITQL
jgi:hypothetical protein